MEDHSPAAVKVSVILESKHDWRLWYEAIQTSAILAGIWDYINPSIEPKPQVPTKPAPIEPPATNETTQSYNHRSTMFTYQNNEYIHYQKGRAAVHNLITSSVSRLLKESYNLYSTDLYDSLKKLQTEFAPSNEELKINALIRYNVAKDSKVDNGSINNWITEFEAAAGELKGLRGDNFDTWQAERDFLEGIKSHSPQFADRHLKDIMRTDHKADLFALTSTFRRYLTTQSVQEPQNAIYGTFKGQPDDQTSRQQFSTCYCGRGHRYRYCWHINKNAKDIRYHGGGLTVQAPRTPLSQRRRSDAVRSPNLQDRSPN
ncbi:hypothetical protein BJX63DRAFT_437812 [Aspergillus granulosus]|uniref:Uncharacterized protein n=1 Tax=Aspergillus granulosus TaxID=176169 RepID=A0ABR4GTX0_9EURO